MRSFNRRGLLAIVAAALALLAGCAIQPLTLPDETGQSAPEEVVSTELPAIFMATSPEYLAGSWMCALEGEPSVVRFDRDGIFYKILGPQDAVAVGTFWFKDGDLHVISNVDRQSLEGVFHAIIEQEGSDMRLKLESCGGNCVTVAGIQWEEGMARIEPGS